MRVTQKAPGSETLDPFLDELSCSFLLRGSLEGLLHSSLFTSFPLYSICVRTQIDASETLTHATELGFRSCLLLRARLYMGDVCV